MRFLGAGRALAGGHNVKAYAAWAAICVIWGTTYLANRYGLISFPPLLMGGTRFFLAGLALAVIARAGRKAGAEKAPFQIGVAVSGVLILAMGVGVVIWAQQWLPSGLTALLVAAEPLWMVLLEAAMPGGERPSRRAWAGLALSFVGVLVIGLDGPVGGFQAEYLWAVGAVLLAGFSWAAGSIYTRRLKVQGGGLAIASQQQLWGGSVLLIAGLLTGEHVAGPVDPRSIAAFAYLVVFGSGIAYLCYLYALKHLPVAFVSSYLYVNPVLALWLGAVLMGERLTPGVFVATGLIFAGLVLMKYPHEAVARQRRRVMRRLSQWAGRPALPADRAPEPAEAECAECP